MLPWGWTAHPTVSWRRSNLAQSSGKEHTSIRTCVLRSEPSCPLPVRPPRRNSAAILERLHQLESRVEELEYQHQEPHYPTSIAATASNNGQDEMDTGVAGAASASGGGTHLHHNRTTSNASDLRSNGTANAGGGETVTPNTPQVLVDRSRHSLQLDSQQQRWESLTADGTSDDPPKDDTEEAAMVLESLCNTSTNLKALKGNNSSYPVSRLLLLSLLVLSPIGIVYAGEVPDPCAYVPLSSIPHPPLLWRGGEPYRHQHHSHPQPMKTEHGVLQS